MRNKYDIEIAKNILRVRLSQMIINERLKKGDFRIPIHLALGHEAIAVAVDRIMESGDKLVLSHRNIHYNLARTKVLKPEIDEYLLQKEGLAGGQLGSMNLANEAMNIVYSSSILGNNLAVAAGLALGEKVKSSNRLVVVVTGDGALEEGSFYETLLFLKSNSLNCLVLVENNNWSLATQIGERRCPIDISKMAESMCIGYKMLDGNDTYQYVNELKDIKRQVLETNAPAVAEVRITTLGGYNVKTEGTHSRFVNYHAGSAPEIELKKGSLIEESDRDPVFVLIELFGDKIIERSSSEIIGELEKEMIKNK